ncbi:MAG: S41 family peptidase [Terriglobia bacterium]
MSLSSMLPMPFKSVWPVWRSLLALFAGSLLLPAGGLFAQSQARRRVPGDAVTAQSLKFAEIYQDLQQNYMDRPDPDRLILEGAVRGMLSSLDPFSSFFDRGQFDQLQQQTRGEAVGFGSILYVQTGKVTVIQAQQGSPSWRAGLGPGDQIMSVNGVALDSLDFNGLIHTLQQARSHPATLSVMRPGESSPVMVHLRPAEVALPTVDVAFLYSGGIAYLHIDSFESKTPQEVIDALKKLGYPNLEGIILDLRNNPGGLLAAAVGVSSLFMDPGTPVLTVRGRTVKETTYRCVAAPIEVSLPLIVLVNGNTASAAEVVTSALQDHDRALVAGEQTFGKGVVESVMPLSDQTAVALLTSAYFTPSGRSIQKPLPGTALANPIQGIEAGSEDSHSSFHTADGRPLSAHGGITPDVLAAAPKPDEWMEFLDQRGTFSQFASEYVTYHGTIAKTFEPSDEMLEEFRNFLTAQRIKSPDEYWSKDQPLLKQKLKAAVFDLVFGLDFSNQAAALSDPQVQKAASLFPRLPGLLKGPAKLPPQLVRNESR